MHSCESSRRRLRLLTVAELHWKNGHEYALVAAKLLKSQGIDFEYRIVGMGSFLEAIAFARHELELDQNVEIIPASDAADPDHYEWADMYLTAAVADGECHGTEEALRRNLFIVCTDALSCASDIMAGAKGFVVPRRNPDAITACITQHLLSES